MTHGVIRFQETVVKGDVNSAGAGVCVKGACAERAFLPGWQGVPVTLSISDGFWRVSNPEVNVAIQVSLLSDSQDQYGRERACGAAYVFVIF